VNGATLPGIRRGCTRHQIAIAIILEHTAARESATVNAFVFWIGKEICNARRKTAMVLTFSRAAVSSQDTHQSASRRGGPRAFDLFVDNTRVL
jgi:hypothetical protein